MASGWKKALARALRRWRPRSGSEAGAHSQATSAPTPPQYSGQHYWYLGPTLALTRLKAGPLLYVDPADEQMSVSIIAYAEWEPEVTAVLAAFLEPGVRVVEVGANIGYYTMTMAVSVGPQGHVTALEANPRLVTLLRKSIHVNGLDDRVRLIPCAAMDVTGSVDFVSFRNHSGSGHVPSHVDADYWDALGTPERYKVDAVRLDDLDCGVVDLIRLDAEGSEPAILRGAAEMLRANREVVICMEWSVVQMASRTSVPDFVDWLVAEGFRFWRIVPGGRLEPIEGSGLLNVAHCDMVAARALPPRLQKLTSPDRAALQAH